MKKQYLPGIISLLLLSCESEIKIKMDPTPPKIVVNASVTPGKDLSAHVSKSWFITESNPNPELPEATVGVYVNDEYQGIMERADDLYESQKVKGQYVLRNSRIQAEDKVTFEVESQGYPSVYSQTQVPSPPDIISIDTLNISSEYEQKIQIYIRLQDRRDERNFYRLIVEKESEFRLRDSVVIIKTPAYSTHDPKPPYDIYGDYFYDYSNFEEYFFIDYDDPVFRPAGSNPLPDQSESFSCWGTFSDDLIEEEVYTLKSVLSGGAMYSYEDSILSHTVHYNIQLLSISESYYQYMKSTWILRFENWDLEGLREPLPTYTNVKNGYGVVSAYQVASKTITMPKQEKRPVNTPFGYIFP